jgi:predicted O-methyltransferase YrrM
MTGSEARLHALIGDDEQPRDDAGAAAWARGYGIVSPDVARYVEVLRGVPDAVVLAMRNIAAAEDTAIVDPDTATLISLLARAARPTSVLEVGTGIGYLTLHLARAVPADCTITSIESDPIRQAQAHAFLERDDYACATELRLGDPLRVLREGAGHARWDMVVLSGADMPRLEVVDAVAENMQPDALLVMPWTLREGMVADNEAAWNGDEQVEHQRTLNRGVATDLRFADVTLLPVGDGLLLARRR